MKKTIKTMVTIMIVIITSVIFSVTAFAAAGTWKHNSTGWWYSYTNGGYAMNKWEYINGAWYYFNGSGYMVTGWQKIGGVWYYFNSSGAMTTGWQKVGGVWYYMNSSGAMTTGWQKIGGVWYYMNSSGAMTTGWQYINGAWYYMNSSGSMYTGWLIYNGKQYYLQPSGEMAIGTIYIGSYIYTFDSSGAYIGMPSAQIRSMSLDSIKKWIQSNANAEYNGYLSYQETNGGVTYNLYYYLKEDSLRLESHYYYDGLIGNTLEIYRTAGSRSFFMFNAFDETSEFLCGGFGHINNATFNYNYPLAFDYFEGDSGYIQSASEICLEMSVDVLDWFEGILDYMNYSAPNRFFTFELSNFGFYNLN